MKTKKMKLSELEVSDENPRTISEMAKRGLKQSIKKFGYLGGIVYNKRTKKIVGGNQKVALLKEMGIEEAEVIVVDINEIEEKALMLALNNQGIQGEFSSEVQNILDDIKAEGPDLFDELRLFTISFDDEELDLGTSEIETEESIYEQTILQPFEHYDYVVILSRTTQDWEWLKEFLELKHVDASIAKAKKIGIGRAIDVKDLMKKVDECRTIK